MDNKIVISVLMSVFNTDFVLVKRAIDSVLNQDYQDFELIIIDDGSNNDTHYQVLDYAKIHEDKVVYLRHKNRGQSNAINRGISYSRGEYITILDADDEYKPNHLRACLNEIKGNDLIASTTKTIVDNENDYYVPDKYNLNRIIHVDDCILFATLFGKKEVFDKLKFQDIYSADSYFYESAAQRYNVKKVDLRTYIYYRNISSSICSTMKKKINALV
ncbi:glycosyltransferase family 2 protein [Arcicella aquatica]|uniref:Glycosyltransferase family 2 protein n=1 Tax=Arcicella aquatica TaxID=217141 RepID=A0ABU5QPY5_9BACT|nr:glycosyltransferase family 2 protein [Arcicella aquatica]MEA5258835.1 glycosyltransferase family 2 protein [Arcicella aquatica]